MQGHDARSFINADGGDAPSLHHRITTSSGSTNYLHDQDRCEGGVRCLADRHGPLQEPFPALFRPPRASGGILRGILEWIHPSMYIPGNMESAFDCQ
jgi:hypothetical protein